MTVFEPVRQARAAWERTQPQLFPELPDATSPPRAGATSPSAAPGRPAATPNTNGVGSTSPEEMSAADAIGGTS